VTTGPVDPWQAQGRRGEGLARLDEAARQREHPLHRRPAAGGDQDATVEIIERDGDRVLHHYVVLPHAARWTGGEPATGPEAG
jgi:hypothetical protein